MNIKRENLLKEIGYNKSLDKASEMNWIYISKIINFQKSSLLNLECFYIGNT
jgi:hypothetical protein